MNKLKQTFGLALVLALVVSAVVPPQVALASSGAVGAANRPDTVQPADGNGRALQLPYVGYQVFEMRGTTTATLLAAADPPTSPTNGVVHKVCVETGTSGTAQLESVILFDSAVAASNTASSERRLGPPLNRATSTERCLELNAAFSRGVTILPITGTNGIFVYWRPNGGRR